MKELVVVAIGGNSIITGNDQQSIQHQEAAINLMTERVAALAATGRNVVVTHGNGPQVGLELRRAELGTQHENLPEMPLVNCVANTQGGIGYQLQQSLVNALAQRGIKKQVVTVITQVEVAADDANFHHPTKPIGAFFTAEQRDALQEIHPDWKFVEDAGRGYRRVVASPQPLQVVEAEVIAGLVESGYIVIALGGGGIPVIKSAQGYRGVDAVIDKDLGSALLAEKLAADTLVITTGVEQVYIHYGKPEQKALSRITPAETRRYIEEGHFPAGSMLPKIEAGLNFLAQGGKQVIITTPEKLPQAMLNQTGTHIVAE